MSEEMKTNQELEQESQGKEIKQEKTGKKPHKEFPLTKKEMAFVGGVFVVGALLGVLLMSLLLGRQGKGGKKTTDNKNSDVKTVSGKYDVQDCVELGKYDGIQVSIAVTQDDLDTEIENLLEENIIYEQKSGKVKDGDMVYADFTGYVDGKKVEATSGSDYVDTASEDDWLEGFTEAFVGAETGKEFSFDVDVPEGTYEDDTVDGKKVTFKATAKYICGEEIVPEYTDDFVDSISEGEYKTTDEYNAYLKQELASEYEAEKSEYSWSDVLEASTVKTYPETMLQEAKDRVLQDYYDMADIYGMSHDEIFQSFEMKDEQDFVDNELDELAQDTVKEQLVVRAIAAKEKINYTEQEYNDIVEEEYTYNSDAYDTKEEYEKADRVYLEETALQTVVKNWIADRAKFITEESDEGTVENNRQAEESGKETEGTGR